MNSQLLKYLFSKFFVRNLIYAFGFAFAFFIGIFLFLRLYTAHNRAYTVPDFSGLNREELAREIEKRKMRFEVVDSVYLRNYPKGTVVDQNPEPGFRVKKDRLIYITMNALGREKTIMPNLKDLSFRQAKVSLENKGLALGKTSFKPYIADNIVLEQKLMGVVIHPGDTLYKGSEIELVLGSISTNSKTRVPNVMGLKKHDAIEKITNAILVVGGVNPDNTVQSARDSANAFVWKQKPEGEGMMRVTRGSLVDIWLTVDSTKLPWYDTLTMDIDEDF